MHLVDNVLKGKPYSFSYRNTDHSEEFRMYHAHQGLELLYVVQGEGHYIIERQLVPMKPGTLLIFQPYQLHRIYAAASADRPYIRHVLVVDPHVFDGFMESLPDIRSFWHRLLKAGMPMQAFQVGDVGTVYDLMNRELQSDAGGHALEAVAMGLMSLLRHIRLQYRDAAPLPGRTSNLAEQAMAWLDAHYREEFSLGRLAEELHISPHYLSHLFKQLTGSSLSDYLIAKKLREACLLLQIGDLPVGDIAERVGYATPSHFIHTFKKHMGVTPRRYRHGLRDAEESLPDTRSGGKS